MAPTVFRKTAFVTLKTAIKIIYIIESLGSIPFKLLTGSYRVAMYSVLLAVVSSVVVVSDSSFDYSLKYLYADNQALPSVLAATTKKDIDLPVKISDAPFPYVTAESLIVVDLKNEKVLFEKNPHLQLPPASTTKMMTALVALEIYKLDEILEVPAYCTKIDSSKAGFSAGDKVLVEDLLNALLISSSGDAACTLAANRPPINFIERMNNKAVELELKDTRFSNAIGLDALNGDHVSSAFDLYVLSKSSMDNPYISDTVRKKEYQLKTGAVQRKIYNTNKLLWDVEGSVGVKTGTTTGAGEVLVYEYQKDNKDIAIIVMRSQDRFGDTRKILDWVLSTYSWEG